jgi:hypothetical protein
VKLCFLVVNLPLACLWKHSQLIPLNEQYRLRDSTYLYYGTSCVSAGIANKRESVDNMFISSILSLSLLDAHVGISPSRRMRPTLVFCIDLCYVFVTGQDYLERTSFEHTNNRGSLLMSFFHFITREKMTTARADTIDRTRLPNRYFQRKFHCCSVRETGGKKRKTNKIFRFSRCVNIERA